MHATPLVDEAAVPYDGICRGGFGGWRRARRCLPGLAALLLAGCALPPAPPAPRVAAADPVAQLRWIDRVTWGADARTLKEVEGAGLAPWLGRQLHPGPAELPAAAQAQIDAMRITTTPLDALAAELDTQRRAIDTLPDGERAGARQTYQRSLDDLARESRQRFVLRALHSPNQLQEQMTWFWMNHFNVSTRKGEVRALVGDYEENAVRPHALGRFRDLLGATLRQVLNEYRMVFGGLFERLYGLSPAQFDRVFGGVAPRDLGLV